MLKAKFVRYGKRLILVMLLLCFSSCQAQGPEISEESGMRLNCIYFSEIQIGEVWPEYKIDLKKREFWVFVVDSFVDYEPRDAEAKNEGFYYVSELESDKIEVFLERYEGCGASQWETTYIKEGIMDGHQWQLRMVYSDGTEQEVFGSNAYPEGWGQLAAALESLTGYKVLEGERPTPKYWSSGQPIY